MWVCVIGTVGSCKSRIVEYLVDNENFVLEDKISDPVEYTTYQPDFWQERDIILNYFDFQLAIQNKKAEEDIATVGSFWDRMLVYFYTYAQFKELSDGVEEPIRKMNRLYTSLTPLLSPPDAFIYCKTDVINSHSRLALKHGKDVGMKDEFISECANKFEGLIPTLRPPVIELDMKEDFSEILENVRYGINSLKTSALTNPTIWDKNVFRVKNYEQQE